MQNKRFLRTVLVTLSFVGSMMSRSALAAPKERVLWSFGGTGDGPNPYAGLTVMHGILYGTTKLGGADGEGTAFELTPPAKGQTQWNENVLWSFGSAGDGTEPLAGVIYHRGKLYGAASRSGAYGMGAVFELGPPLHDLANWSETVLWSFLGRDDGAGPHGGLIDWRGKLYGTTENVGAVFELAPPS